MFENAKLVNLQKPGRHSRKLLHRFSFQNSSSSPGNQSIMISSGSGEFFAKTFSAKILYFGFINLTIIKLKHSINFRRKLSNFFVCISESKAGLIYLHFKVEMKYFMSITGSVSIWLSKFRLVEEIFAKDMD